MGDHISESGLLTAIKNESLSFFSQLFASMFCQISLFH